MVPEVDPGLVVDVHHDVELREATRDFLLDVPLRPSRQVIGIEVDDVVILDSLAGFKTVPQVPDGLGDTAGPEPQVGGDGPGADGVDADALGPDLLG